MSTCVYVASYWVDCEGGDIIGVYGTLETAQQHADRFLAPPCRCDSVHVIRYNAPTDGSDEWTTDRRWSRGDYLADGQWYAHKEQEDEEADPD